MTPESQLSPVLLSAHSESKEPSESRDNHVYSSTTRIALLRILITIVALEDCALADKL